MAFESWGDAMFWHGSLIGYMTGVKSACKDEDKSSLLLRMADTQARLESMEAENAKLREMASALRQCLNWESCKGCPMHDNAGWCVRDNRLRELGIEVDA